jgi:adenylyl cyclase-associated protein
MLRRLEAVTSRLEDLYEHAGKSAPQPSSTAAPAAATAPVSPHAIIQTQVIEEPPSVVAYHEQVLKGRVQPFVKLTGTFPNTSVVEQVRSIPLLCKTFANDSAL